MLNHGPNVDDSAEMTHSLRIPGTRQWRLPWMFARCRRANAEPPRVSSAAPCTVRPAGQLWHGCWPFHKTRRIARFRRFAACLKTIRMRPTPRPVSRDHDPHARAYLRGDGIGHRGPIVGAAIEGLEALTS
jgi:hypothetical protein